MVSISSASEIKKRSISFLKENFDKNKIDRTLVASIKNYLQKEYELIPQKERIGKGMVYITKHFSKSFYQFIKETELKNNLSEQKREKFKNLILKIIDLFDDDRDLDKLRLAIHLAGNLAFDYFKETLNRIGKWADHENWEIRENSIYPILSGLKKHRKEALEFLKNWADDGNPNYRRFVAECLRPKTDIKWLRDPDQNDVVLELLTKLNHDNSIYVRKAVGNNLKDLTKYMPEKILALIENWLNEKNKLTANEKKSLLWTIFQALRWLKDKKPEYHDWIKKLIGENYIKYFDEKKNRFAKPPQNKK